MKGAGRISANKDSSTQYGTRGKKSASYLKANIMHKSNTWQ